MLVAVDVVGCAADGLLEGVQLCLDLGAYGTPVESVKEGVADEGVQRSHRARQQGRLGEIEVQAQVDECGVERPQTMVPLRP